MKVVIQENTPSAILRFNDLCPGCAYIVEAPMQREGEVVIAIERDGDRHAIMVETAQIVSNTCWTYRKMAAGSVITLTQE